MRFRFLLIFVLSGFLPLVVSGQSTTITHEEYISKYSATAISNMREFGIPASITLAQALLESGAGNSDLARNANNHFGIKCHAGWEGETYLQDDDAKNECFRKYKDPAESFADHARFLSSRSRYASLFKLEPTDYKGWAHGLKAAGYATNPHYAERLIGLIEKYNLSRFDVAGESGNPHQKKRGRHKVNPKGSSSEAQAGSPEAGTIQGRKILKNNGVKYILAKEGETLKSIADEIQIRPWMLRKYNDMDTETSVREGDKIYLQSKKKRSKIKEHTTIQGETLHGISQQYGIKLKSLCKINQLTPGSTVKPGTVLKLR